MNLYSTCTEQFLELKKVLFQAVFIIHGAGDGGKAKQIFILGVVPLKLGN